MDKIKKLLRKIGKKDREKLLELLEKVISKDKFLRIKKVKDTDFFRVRYKNFRIIFHKEKGEVIVDSIRLRSEKTYKNLK